MHQTPYLPFFGFEHSLKRLIAFLGWGMLSFVSAGSSAALPDDLDYRLNMPHGWSGLAIEMLADKHTLLVLIACEQDADSCNDSWRIDTDHMVEKRSLHELVNASRLSPRVKIRFEYVPGGPHELWLRLNHPVVEASFEEGKIRWREQPSYASWGTHVRTMPMPNAPSPFLAPHFTLPEEAFAAGDWAKAHRLLVLLLGERRTNLWASLRLGDLALIQSNKHQACRYYRHVADKSIDRPSGLLARLRGYGVDCRWDAPWDLYGLAQKIQPMQSPMGALLRQELVWTLTHATDVERRLAALKWVQAADMDPALDTDRMDVHVPPVTSRALVSWALGMESSPWLNVASCIRLQHLWPWHPEAASMGLGCARAARSLALQSQASIFLEHTLKANAAGSPLWKKRKGSIWAAKMLANTHLRASAETALGQKKRDFKGAKNQDMNHFGKSWVLAKDSIASLPLASGLQRQMAVLEQGIDHLESIQALKAKLRRKPSFLNGSQR